jgi:hypothetical protein
MLCTTSLLKFTFYFTLSPLKYFEALWSITVYKTRFKYCVKEVSSFTLLLKNLMSQNLKVLNVLICVRVSFWRYLSRCLISAYSLMKIPNICSTLWACKFLVCHWIQYWNNYRVLMFVFLNRFGSGVSDAPSWCQSERRGSVQRNQGTSQFSKFVTLFSLFCDEENFSCFVPRVIL